MYDVTTEGIAVIFRTIGAYSSVQQKVFRETVETFSCTSHLLYDLCYGGDSLSNTDLLLHLNYCIRNTFSRFSCLTIFYIL